MMTQKPYFPTKLWIRRLTAYLTWGPDRAQVNPIHFQTETLPRFPFAAMLGRQVWDIDAYLRMTGTTSDDAPALRQVMIEGRSRIRMAPRLDAAIVHQLLRPTPARVKPLCRNAEWVAVYHGDGFAGYVHATLISADKYRPHSAGTATVKRSRRLRVAMRGGGRGGCRNRRPGNRGSRSTRSC